MTAGCPSWCVRHTEVPGHGTVHHSEVRKFGADDGYAYVWVFRLPSGQVRIAVDSLTFPAPGDYRNDVADLAALLAQLGHAELAAAVTAAAELAGAS